MKRLKPADIFESDQLSQDLARKSVQGGLWTLFVQGVRFVTNLVRTVILARLLTPDDFGLVAMVVVFVDFAQMLKEAGLSMATIQRDKITYEQISTLFWINLFISLFLGALIFFSAPLISRFYDRPELTAVTAVLSLTVVISGIVIQYHALFRRHMMFGTIAFIQIVTQILTIGATVLLALLGFRYWSLVWGAIVSVTVSTMLTFYFCPWLPGRMRRRSKIRDMLRFGGHLITARIIQYLVRNLDNVLLGVAWGAGTVGFYSKAYGLLMLPINQLYSPISTVAVPTLSRVSQDISQFRRYYCKGLRYVTFFSVPLVVFSFIAAQDIVLLVLGDQWRACIRLFQALAPAALLGPIGFASGWVARVFSCATGFASALTVDEPLELPPSENSSAGS